MDDAQTDTQQTTSKSSPLLAIGVIAVIAVVGGMVLLKKNNNTAPETAQNTMTAPTAAPTNAETTPAVAGAEDSTVKTITVEGGEFYFKPTQITVKKGDTVKVVFHNVDGFHDFVIDEFNVRTKQIKGDATDEVTFTADKTGSFEYYCSVGKHRQMGMKGTLIVE